MTQHIAFATLVVLDSDGAVAWYANVPGFDLRENLPRGGKRGDLVEPRR